MKTTQYHNKLIGFFDRWFSSKRGLGLIITLQARLSEDYGSEVEQWN